MMQAPANEKYSVFIIDDHPLFRIGLRSLLESDGNIVICGEADNSESALSQLRTLRTDLVIVDIALRGTNGIDLLKQLKTEQPELRALLMSMYDEELYAERALRAGAIGYIKKDSPPELVVDAVFRALRGGIVLSKRGADSLLRRLTQGIKSDTGAELPRLSDRELEIFRLMGQGASTRECAERLHVSIKTVEAHQSSIKTKLGITGANQLRRYAVLWANEQRKLDKDPGEV
jgi:DNA-binding NarL/FixJ family response regulator